MHLSVFREALKFGTTTAFAKKRTNRLFQTPKLLVLGHCPHTVCERRTEVGKSRQYRRDHPEVFTRKAPKPKRRSKKFLTRHHDFAKAKGGTWDEWNIYKLSAEHHSAYHKLFGLRTFAESARVLMRMEELHREHLNSERSPNLPGERRVA
jgi:hypothetical protein